MVIQYERTFQGAHKFYAMKGGYLVQMSYFFTSKAQALKEFKSYLAEA